MLTKKPKGSEYKIAVTVVKNPVYPTVLYKEKHQKNTLTSSLLSLPSLSLS